MGNYYYKKSKWNTRRFIQAGGIIVFFTGFSGMLYIFFPFISWHIFFAPTFAAQRIAAPIPQTTVLTPATIGSLLQSGITSLQGVDYTDAKNWFPGYNAGKTKSIVPSYTLSIPAVGIQHAFVSTQDYDLSKHLINYIGTAAPPNKGNAVILGHSTLPQLYNPTDYTTIFATIYKLKIGDEIIATVNNISYYYKIFSIIVIDPSDTSVFAQQNDTSYLTLITCTPPGTTWKRLVIKAQIRTL